MNVHDIVLGNINEIKPKSENLYKNQPGRVEYAKKLTPLSKYSVAILF